MPDTDLAPLSKRQSAVLAYMHKHHDTWNMWPTVREIGERLKIGTTNGVMGHLKAMKKKGYVTNIPNASRSWRPIKRTEDIKCPHCSGMIEVVEELG